MLTKSIGDPDLEACMLAAVARGEFSTVEQARADFWTRLEHSIAQADAGELIDAEVVFARLHERYANWPRAAAE